MQKLSELFGKICSAIERGKKGVLVDLQTISEIRDEFWALEQRASNLNDGWLNAIAERDEARAKLADLAKQKPRYFYREHNSYSGMKTYWTEVSAEQLEHLKEIVDMDTAEIIEVFTRTAPAVSIIPDGLHPSTAELVLSFANALAEKLYRSEQKYGWSDGWKDSGWQDKCLSDFQHHITKGDPRDVAAYCAFMWHHGWETRPAPAADLVELVPDEMTWNQAHYLLDINQCGEDRFSAFMMGANHNRAAILRNIEDAGKKHE